MMPQIQQYNTVVPALAHQHAAKIVHPVAGVIKTRYPDEHKIYDILIVDSISLVKYEFGNPLTAANFLATVCSLTLDHQYIPQDNLKLIIKGIVFSWIPNNVQELEKDIEHYLDLWESFYNEH